MNQSQTKRQGKTMVGKTIFKNSFAANGFALNPLYVIKPQSNEA